MRRAAAVLVSLCVIAGGARAEGDAAAGKAAFAKCGICHSVKQGENKIGPSLFGVVGRPSHSLAGYNYSDPMKAYDATWDGPTLDHYLADPRQTVPGTRMIFPGIKSETERSNIIAYLQTLK